MLKYFTILTEINFIWLGDVSQVTQWSSLMPSFLRNCWKKPERNSGFDGIRTHFSFPVCTCATVYLHSFLRMKKAIIVKGTIIYNNFLSKMVFLLSIRLCRFYREAWTEDREGPVRKIRSSSRPPTEVCGFHQTLKQKNKAIRRKIPQATRAIKGSTGLISKFSKSHREKSPWDAPSIPNGLLQSLGKAARTSPWTYLCKIFPPRITSQTERFKSGWRERQRDSIVRSQTHKRTLKHVFCKTTVF